MSLAWEQNLIKGEQAQNAEKYEEADKIFRAALPEAEGFPAEDPRLSFLLRLLAGNSVALGRMSEAEDWMRRCLEACEKSRDKETTELAKVLEQYAKLMKKMDRPAEAEPFLKRAAEQRKKAVEGRPSWAGATSGWSSSAPAAGPGTAAESDPSNKKKDGTAEQGAADKNAKAPTAPKDGTAEQGAAEKKKGGK